MSEERRQVHPEEPAEGSREEAGEATEPTEEQRSAAHPQAPAEGGDEEVDG